MGGWISVACNCNNQRADAGSGSRQEYTCDHENGELKGVSYALVLTVGDAVRATFGDNSRTFEVFLKIIDPTNFVAERLVLSSEETALWELEIEQLREYLNQSPPMARNFQQRWEAYWNYPGGWIGGTEYTHKEGLQQSGIEIEDILNEIGELCLASALSGNPIECWQ